jgi:hypothetical protein
MSRETRIKFPAEPMIYSTATAQEISSGDYITWELPVYKTPQIKQKEGMEKIKISAIGSGFYHIEVDAIFFSQTDANEVGISVEINGEVDNNSISYTVLQTKSLRYYLAINHIVFVGNRDEIKIKVTAYDSIVLYKARFIMRWIPIEGWNNRKGGRNMNTFEEVR